MASTTLWAKEHETPTLHYLGLDQLRGDQIVCPSDRRQRLERIKKRTFSLNRPTRPLIPPEWFPPHRLRTVPSGGFDDFSRDSLARNDRWTAMKRSVASQDGAIERFRGIGGLVGANEHRHCDVLICFVCSSDQSKQISRVQCYRSLAASRLQGKEERCIAFCCRVIGIFHVGGKKSFFPAQNQAYNTYCRSKISYRNAEKTWETKFLFCRHIPGNNPCDMGRLQCVTSCKSDGCTS
ncbi:hypothetical protein BX600DRAFT_259375 [Xylariales sp. PMI_506]|nr:hypothetical protein BX600DRAFT_259375 [Xylariales sp. PMI_506]